MRDEITKDHVIFPELLELLEPDMKSAIRWNLQKQLLRELKIVLSGHMPGAELTQVLKLLEAEMRTMATDKGTLKDRSKFYYDLGNLADYFSPDRM